MTRLSGRARAPAGSDAFALRRRRALINRSSVLTARSRPLIPSVVTCAATLITIVLNLIIIVHNVAISTRVRDDTPRDMFVMIQVTASAVSRTGSTDRPDHDRTFEFDGGAAHRGLKTRVTARFARPDAHKRHVSLTTRGIGPVMYCYWAGLSPYVRLLLAVRRPSRPCVQYVCCAVSYLVT